MEQRRKRVSLATACWRHKPRFLAPRKKKINRSKVSPKVTPFVFRHSGTDGLVYLRWKIHSDRCYRHRARAMCVDARSQIRGSRRVRRNRTRLSVSLCLSVLSEIVTVTLTTRQQRGLLVISIRRAEPAPIPPLINYYHRFTRVRHARVTRTYPCRAPLVSDEIFSDAFHAAR